MGGAPRAPAPRKTPHEAAFFLLCFCPMYVYSWALLCFCLEFTLALLCVALASAGAFEGCLGCHGSFVLLKRSALAGVPRFAFLVFVAVQLFQELKADTLGVDFEHFHLDFIADADDVFHLVHLLV